jgi:methyltransferase (TIGR00027 family)
VSAAALENPVSLTAYWTLAARYEDAAEEQSIAGDSYAHRFMNDDVRAVAERFRRIKKANASFPVRHRMIDDMLAAELARDPGLRVVVIGCGFDSRAFRLRGGRWIEVDEPALLAYKECRVPTSEATNELVRVPIRFGRESLDEKLGPYAGEDRAAVVLEGVIGYLGDDERRELLLTLTRVFPHHVVLCDMLTRTFLRRYARKLVKIVRELGAEFSSSGDAPEALFHELGYRTVESVSVVLRATELRAKNAPPAWLARRLPSLRDGYRVWRLEHSPEQN